MMVLLKRILALRCILDTYQGDEEQSSFDWGPFFYRLEQYAT